LTAADLVIVIEPSWNPATDSQAVDRAFRLGQTKNVVVPPDNMWNAGREDLPTSDIQRLGEQADDLSCSL